MSEILSIWSGAPNTEELIKAMQEEQEAKKKLVEPKSAIIDPTNAYGVMGTRQKPSSVPFATLRNMAKVPAISAIINTRLNQVARFARRPRFNGDMGFQVVLKDKERKMTDTERKRAFELEEFFLRTGNVKNRKRKDNFNRFLRKVVRDTLTLDAMTWEIVPNRKGEPSEVWAVDSATIEVVVDSPTGEYMEVPVYVPMTKAGQSIEGEVAYIQRVNGQVVAEYTEDELAYAIRNPRTDLDYTDFGLSELETLMEIVTGIVNGVRYNTTYFSHSHLPQGVLEIVGKYQDKHLESFKRHWKTMTSGASGKWAVPVMALEDGQGFKFTPFKNSNRDMEFNEFLEFLFNIACAVYQIDPNEVGFKSWTSNSGGMSQSDNTEAKLEQSQDKGFIPLMNFLSDTFNSEILDRIDPDYAFEWVGVDMEDEQRKWAQIKEKLESGVTTVAEVRKQEDMEEILDDDNQPARWTLAPANPQLIQVYMSELQATQQAEQAKQQAEMQQGQQQADQQFQDQQGEKSHQRQLEVMDKQHEQGKEMASVQGKQEDQMADKTHDQQKELTEMQHKQASELAQQDRAHQQVMENHKQRNTEQTMDKQHEQGKEVRDDQHEKQKEMADHNAKHASEGKKQDYNFQHAQGEKNHERSKEMAQMQADHQKDMFERQQKAGTDKKQLKKSLGYDEDDYIIIDWNRY